MKNAMPQSFAYLIITKQLQNYLNSRYLFFISLVNSYVKKQSEKL